MISSPTREERDDRKAHQDYAREYSGWIHSLEEQAGAGNKSAREELRQLKRLGESCKINLLEPLKYDRGHRPSNEEERGCDPADLAVDRRLPIVDFETVTPSELQRRCDHFGSALEWATRRLRNGNRPDLLQMGWRWLLIVKVLWPEFIGGMDLRLPRLAEAQLRTALGGSCPLETGFFFRRVLAYVRKSNSLSQLGQRGYSAIYILRGDLVDSITCQEIGEFKNATRQAANKPIQDFRDTFKGIKSLPMRGEKTRNKCRNAPRKSSSLTAAK